jgi:hypothetical protein
VPRIDTAAQNTDHSIAICTSVGFRTLEFEDYLHATDKLRADIAMSMPDIPSGEKVSRRRVEKAADRTHAWLRDSIPLEERSHRPLFASIPPLTAEQQQLYLSDLSTEYIDSLSGLSIYDPSTALTIPLPLSHLPLLCISDPPTPHALLHPISLGIDLITVPFVTTASEQGLAFTFTFPAPPPQSPQASSASQSSPSQQSTTSPHQKHPLALDLFSPVHSTSLTPLTHPSTCNCYTCTSHSPAYLTHLLSTHEMLAWTLLQIHNFCVLNSFYTSLRTILDKQGQQGFEHEVKRFEEYYAAEFPITDDQDQDQGQAQGQGQGAKEGLTGEASLDRAGVDGASDVGDAEAKAKSDAQLKRGPRVRGYQRKSQGRQLDKKRDKVWGRFDSKESTLNDKVDSAVEDDQALKIKEAREAVAAAVRATGKDKAVAHPDIELTADEIEMLGLAEKEETVKH